MSVSCGKALVCSRILMMAGVSLIKDLKIMEMLKELECEPLAQQSEDLLM